MNNFNWSAFILAILVVIIFIAVGFAIALRSIWLIILLSFLGFFLMGYGIARKKKRK